ncbi:MAG: twin-arginine translocase TatA/TatE family subunit [Gemmatimonadaceae bacterium]
MPFGNLGFGEIVMILVLVLLLFGAKRLPEIGASMGKGIREFKKSITDVDRSLSEGSRDERSDRPRAADPVGRKDSADEPPEPKRLLK